MQVQCVICEAMLEAPVGPTTLPHLQCRCGAIVPLPAASRINKVQSHSESSRAGTTSPPLSFKLVGENPAPSVNATVAQESAPAAGLRLVKSALTEAPVLGQGDSPLSLGQPSSLRLADAPSAPSRSSISPPLTTTPSAFRLVSQPDEQDGGLALADKAEALAVAPPPVSPQRAPVRESKTTTAVETAGLQRPRTGRPRPGAWRQCVEHPPAKSETMCPTCAVGYCSECNKPICPTCDSPCIPASGYQKWLEQQRLRARPMMSEIKTILAYPLQDPMAFFIFAAITGFFSFAMLFSPRAIIFSWGILLWYSFHTLYQVASGNLTRFIPEFNDISDLTHPLRLSGMVMLVTWGPLLLVGVLFTVNVGMGVNFASLMGGPAIEEPAEEVSAPTDEEDPTVTEVQSLLGGIEDEEEGRAEAPAEKKPEQVAPSRKPLSPPTPSPAASTRTMTTVSLFLFLALVWKVAYTPVALIVAALSKNVLSVVNPLIGIDTIRRMGPVYWHVVLIYTGLTVVELGLGKVLGILPIVGAIGMAFVKAYMAVATGCALGLAVYKKAPELGWD